MSINIRAVSKLHPDKVVGDCTPLFINTLTNTKEDKELLNSHIHTTLNGDMSVKPTCNCRFTSDHIALTETGAVCPKCGTPVCTNVNREILPTLFLKCPEGINTLLLPNFVQHFRDAFGTTKFDALSWLVNTNYRKFLKTDPTLKILVEAGIERGWNYFTNNIERIMVLLITESSNLKNKQTTHDTLAEYRKYKKQIHTQHLYFPSSVLFVIEATAVGNYLDFIFVVLKDVVLGMTGVDLVEPLQRRENIIGRNLIELGSFYSNYFIKTYGSKPGLLRTALMSAKGIYVLRAVVVGITRPHKYHSIELPWSGAIMMLRTHIVSVLLRRRMKLNDILAWIQARVHTYCEDMENILNTLVANAGPDGLPCTLQRFPSLTTGSFVKVYCDRIKINPRDWCIGVPLLIVRGFNMDFDGDSGHVSLLNDQLMSDFFEPLEYHYNLLDPLKPRSINGNMSLTNPIVSNACDWVEKADILNEPTAEENAQMAADFT